VSVARIKTKLEKNLMDIKNKIRTFIVENFLFGKDEGLDDETSFLDEGIIDSTGILELVSFMEETFNIKVEDEELVPENLDSIKNVVAYLEKKVSGQ
jgi:acyl carrier protein